MKKNNVLYWSPFIGRVATIKSVINSAKSLNLYSNKINAIILDCFGEWNSYKKEIQNNNTRIIKLNRKFKIDIDNFGFLKSRFIYIKSFFKLYWKLKKLIIIQKPKYLIAHLLTYIPFLLFFFNNLETKLILRISGKPRLNLFRKLLWKLVEKKINIIFCPTKETRDNLRKNFFKKSKIIYLPDPIINNIKNRYKTPNKKKSYFLCVGRLTKQKNQKLLIDLYIKYKLKTNLIIVGDGELKKKLQEKIKNNNLQKIIQIKPFTKHINKYYKYAKAILIPSLWEDPGFVMIESAYLRKPIICSNCKSGPEEFLRKNKAGIIFKNNNLISLYKKIKKFENLKKNKINNMINNAYVASKNYTLFSHYKIIKNYLK